LGEGGGDLELEITDESLREKPPPQVKRRRDLVLPRIPTKKKLGKKTRGMGPVPVVGEGPRPRKDRPDRTFR